ncbi:30S ribosomal protein S17 [bacterium]|nr:30S ribosomal protein S17 [bacterium]
MIKAEKEIKSKKEVKFRELKGLIVSDKMDKTVVVKVDNIKRHKIYKKSYTISIRYKAHDENNEYQVGDFVLIRQIRPLSKEKRWQVIRKIK